MNKIISVTRDDINNGVPNEGCVCPIAQAVKRIYGKSSVYVDRDSMDWDTGSSSLAVPLPQEARDFVARFDAGLPVEPFSFEVGDEFDYGEKRKAKSATRIAKPCVTFSHSKT